MRPGRDGPESPANAPWPRFPISVNALIAPPSLGSSMQGSGPISGMKRRRAACALVRRPQYGLADHMAAMKIGDERDDAGTEGGGGRHVGRRRLGRDGIAAAMTIGAVVGRGARADQKIRLTEITISTGNATAKGLKNRIFSPGQAAAGHGSLEVIPLR
jgi:hypothetical protein